MTVKFAPLWEEASNILKIISESNDEIVAELAFKWISGEEFKDEDTPCVRDSPSPSTLGPFECSNYRFLEQLAEQCTLDDFSANVQIRAMFSTV
jgi:U3 small nucleolar RNA-associated protein 20